MKRFFLLLSISLLLSLSFHVRAQIDKATLGFPLFYADYGVIFPGGEFGKQFGISNEVGGGFMYKTQKNWLFGVEGHYMFGQNINNEEDLFSLIETDQGFVIDDNGYRSEIRLHLRGVNVFARFGKLFPVFGPNSNSGIVLIGGVGYMNHYVFIDVMDNMAEPLTGDYRYGYDQFAGGFATSQFLGYMHFSNSRLMNFFIGVEAIQGFSKYYRDWDFNNMAAYPKYDGIDMMINIKIGWVFPVYRRTPKEYYTN